MDLSREYLLIDDPLTVSYQVKTAEGTWAAGVAVEYAQRSKVDKADIPQSLLEKDATAFHVWKDNLGGIVPKIGDKLTVGRTWVVMSVEECDRDSCGIQRWKLLCIRSNS